MCFKSRPTGRGFKGALRFSIDCIPSTSTAHFKQKPARDVYWCLRGLPQRSLDLAQSFSITHKHISSTHSGCHWLANVRAGLGASEGSSAVYAIVSRPALSAFSPRRKLCGDQQRRKCWMAVNWGQICRADSHWWRKLKRRSVREAVDKISKVFKHKPRTVTHGMFRRCH